MRRYVAALSLGLLLGLVLGLSIPSNADDAAIRRLTRRVIKLEEKTGELERDGTMSSLNVRPGSFAGQCNSGDPAVWRITPLGAVRLTC